MLCAAIIFSPIRRDLIRFEWSWLSRFLGEFAFCLIERLRINLCSFFPLVCQGVMFAVSTNYFLALFRFIGFYCLYEVSHLVIRFL